MPTVTVSTVPLTEIVAVVTFAVKVEVGGAGLEGVVVEPPVDEPVPPLDVDGDVAGPEPAEAAPVLHCCVPQSVICWANGSLLLKRLNETS